MRAVFDTNVVISALVFGRSMGWLRSVWAGGAVIPLRCGETEAELRRVLTYPKFRLTRDDQEQLLESFLPFSEYVLLPGPWPEIAVPCRDPDDLIFIQLALAAGADVLVTGDIHLMELKDACPVPIVGLAQMKALCIERGF